jgi:hypothetical protein
VCGLAVTGEGSLHVLVKTQASYGILTGLYLTAAECATCSNTISPPVSAPSSSPPQTPLAADRRAQSQTNTMNEWSTRNGARLGRAINLTARSSHRPVVHDSAQHQSPARAEPVGCWINVTAVGGHGLQLILCRYTRRYILAIRRDDVLKPRTCRDLEDLAELAPSTR